MDPPPGDVNADRAPAAGTAHPRAGAGTGPAAQWQPGLPSVREHLPSLLWGAGLPICVYFLVRRHVRTDADALIIAGAFSVAWIFVQFVRQRRVDIIGALVLLGFAVGIVGSTLLGGNAYLLKVRDSFLTGAFGVACVVTVFTHERPAFFYLSRYFSAGTDKDKVSAYNRLYEFSTGRHAFRVLSVVWGIGLFVEAGCRLTLAALLPTGTFLAVSPFLTASIIGSLFAFTVVFTKRTRLMGAGAFPTRPEPDGHATEPVTADVADASPRIPLR
jgi:hypothetical protein